MAQVKLERVPKKKRGEKSCKVFVVTLRDGGIREVLFIDRTGRERPQIVWDLAHLSNVLAVRWVGEFESFNLKV